LVSRDVVFVEDAVQPLLSCSRDIHVRSHDVYKTLLPLFGSAGGQSHAAQNEANIQPPMQVSHDSTDQPISDADVYDALEGERTEIEESRSMPKWLVQTLRDSKLDAPLPACTRFGSQHASYASDCFALAVASMYDEEEPVLFEEAQH